ncbi:MAG: glycoside hydrolase family 18 protein [Sebaldella sp.]|nr:glycoside hydrolase family 18 protein [Sebaldella sp.]
MRKYFIVIAIIFVSILSFSANAKTENTKPKKILSAYLPSWIDWDVNEIRGNELTSIKLSFILIKDGKAVFGEDSPSSKFEENFDKLKKLKNKYPHLKILVAVGGWGADGFSDMAASENSRKIFIDSLMTIVEKYELDGLDIDWEFPVNGAWGLIKSSPLDKENFTLLMRDLRFSLNELSLKTSKQYSLSFAASVGPWFLDVVDLKDIMNYVDYVSIMGYDIAGGWSGKTEHQAGLYRGESDWSVSEAVTKFINAGVKPSQIVIGFPFYGKEFLNVKNENNGLYQPFNGMGGINGEGYLPYKNIKDIYANNKDYKRFFDKTSQVSYLFNAKDGIFISYNDSESLKIGAEYIKKNNLAGAMIWEITQDDKEGTLLKALYDNLK